MGIHQLNRFIQTNCIDAVNKKHFKELKGKTVVVDASIYMYKYAKESCIIEGIYNMITTFKYFDITPIFIFDGKPPVEKYEILDNRRAKKHDAEDKYNRLKSILQKKGKSTKDINRDSRLINYKNIFVKVYKTDIDAVKTLIKLFGLEYYTAIGEADKLCASMVINNKAWACMSEDMDLFVYGCPIILRYVSFINQTCIVYDFNKIVGILGLNKNMFAEMCICTGTDYNKGIDNIYNIYKNICMIKKYNIKFSIYEWLCEDRGINRFYIDIDYVKTLFTVTNNIEDSIDFNESSPIKEIFCIVNLKKFLNNYNFIFI
jgi:5'-3' exonuclease